ncbi:heparan-alpha-glucosaminide N-acetyltransferase domain-containing protein [Nocardioides sp. CPCC 205120]|uniref:heparan-alpha-glucosaminide N-acetyltransferase domain-containing protein n=1 Tax=Nocardioides sp. CPCC 205120 TaxID=3406462 RepID=UPI003B508563
MPVPTPSRDLAVDAARGVALLSMFVAHFAPTLGPGQVLLLADHLTAPLFALLIGWGAQLGRGRRGEWSSVLVRGAALVGLGLVLEDAGAQIAVVLVWLGVLTLLAVLLVRLPDVVLAVAAAALLWTAPDLVSSATTHLGEWRIERVFAGEPADGLYPRALEVLAAGPFYRLVELAPMAAAGVLLARHSGRVVTLVTLAAAALLAAALLGAEAAGEVALAPYSGTHLVLALELALCVLVVQGARALESLPGAAGRVVRPVLALLAGAGAVALTAYVVQVLVAAAWVRDAPPGTTDDSWLLLGGLAAGTVALGWAWPRIVRWRPWDRGPVEGPLRALAQGLDRVPPFRRRRG